MRTLPDLLRPGLRLVFVGLNPGGRSAREGHYYAHPGNAFWGALSASPLVDGAVGPADDRALVGRYGIGFTDLVKRVESDSARVGAAERRAQVPALTGRIAYAHPEIVCFTAAAPFDAVFPGVRRPHHWGAQGVRLAGARAWVMPSTSGRAAGSRRHVHAVLRRLGDRLPAAAAPGPDSLDAGSPDIGTGWRAERRSRRGAGR